MRKITSAQEAAGVPRDCQHMGLAASDFGRIASDAAYQLSENRKMMIFAGYRTYMVAAAVLMLAGMKWMGVEVPAEVWLVLNALGLGFLRAAIDEPKP